MTSSCENTDCQEECSICENTDLQEEYSISSGILSLDFSTTTTTDTEFESPVKKEKWSENPSKLDKIADKIINTVTIKGKKRLIDQDKPEDNITYEESEGRLIFLGLSLAVLLALSSLVCIILIVQALQVKDLTVLVAESVDKSQQRFPVPHVVFMDRLGDGLMMAFEQINQSHFDYTWQFKVPDQGGYIQTYFLFEDSANIYVSFSNRNLPMTVIQPSRNHKTIRRSKLRQEFAYGHSFRLGDFIMFFGGQNGYTNFNKEGDAIDDIMSTHRCSSVKDQHNKVTTELWSIKRQTFFKGPYLPLQEGCVLNAGGVSINRTHGMVLYAFSINDEPSVPEELLAARNQSCIDAFIYSTDTFEWVAIRKCFLPINNLYFFRKFSCSAIWTKNEEIQVVLVFEYDDHGSVENKIIMVNYPTFEYESFLLEKDVTMTFFSLRANIYLVNFHQETLSFHRFDLSNKSLIPIQEFTNLIISDLHRDWNSKYLDALPLYV